MKRILTILVLLLSARHLLAADFDPNRTTENYLTIYYDNGQSYKSFRTGDTDRSLAGTGLTGSVLDGGDHWIVNITGGSLAGHIRTHSGVEIRLNGCSVVLTVAGSGSPNGINGDGGVKIVGPGTLHIDQPKSSSAILSGASGVGKTTIVSGACVAVNNLNRYAAVRSYDGIRIDKAALHINSEGLGMFTDGPMAIPDSIVTVISKDTAAGADQTSISCSSVHLGGGNASRACGLECGDLSVSRSVFCSSGGMDGIRLSPNCSAVFENVIGVVTGGEIGIYQAAHMLVSGGATKLTIIGNALGTKDGSRGYHDHCGQAVFPASSSSVRGPVITWSTFSVSGGRVDLYAPGNYALVCGTNVVSAGTLNIRSDPDFGDFRTLYTVSGAALAAEAVAGSIAYGSDLLFTDAVLAQVLESSWTAAAASLSVDEAKPLVGICANELSVTGGRVGVEASGTGILVGGTGLGHEAGFLDVEGGSVSIVSDGVAVADREAWAGSADWWADDSLIWISGGRLSAKGGLDGILTCGGLLMDGGTVEAAATGGHAAGTTSADPGLVGYALSANNGFAIDGGSFLATKGALRTYPNASGAHGWAKLYPVALSVPGAPADKPVAISGFKPSWYGVNDLYPVQGKLQFWLPAGTMSLQYGGRTISATPGGSAASGSASARTVAFSANGGKVSKRKVSVKPGAAVGALPTPTRKGYVFTGWYTAKSGGAKVSAATKITRNTTLYAQWAKKSYKVKFVPNGGTGRMAVQKMTYGKAKKLRANKFKRKGYVFMGWSKKKNGALAYKNKKAVKNLTKKGGTVKLYAKWGKKVVVKFNPNGGKVAKKKKTCVAGQAIGTLPVPTRKGWIFDGWATERDGGAFYGSTSPFPRAQNELRLFANWGKSTTLSFDPTGGAVSLKKMTFEVGRLKTLPTPVRDGWFFKGWYTKPSGGKEVESTVLVKKSMRLYAHWGNTRYVLFSRNGGVNCPEGRSYAYGKPFGWFPTPEREGFSFDGWWTSWTSTASRYSETDIVRDQVYLYAHWAPKAIVKFNGNGGTPDVASREFVALYDAPALHMSECRLDDATAWPVATRPGFTFDGWYSEPEGGDRVGPVDDAVYWWWTTIRNNWQKNRIVPEPKTVYAHWRTNGD